jgi:hypothetical protein
MIVASIERSLKCCERKRSQCGIRIGVEDSHTKHIKIRRRCMEGAAPTKQIRLTRIVQAALVTAVPVNSAVKPHVEADKDDLRGSELNHNIERLEP